MVGIWLFVVSNFFYFMPLIFSVYSIIDLNALKVYFCVKLFGITLIGGYCTFDEKSVYLHVGEKTAVKADYSKMFKSRKNVLDFKAATVLSIKSSVITNFNCDKINCFLMALCVLNSAAIPIIKSKKGYVTIKNDIAFCYNCPTRAFFLKVNAATNLFSINAYITAKILEKFKNAKRKIKYRKSA